MGLTTNRRNYLLSSWEKPALFLIEYHVTTLNERSDKTLQGTHTKGNDDSKDITFCQCRLFVNIW